jgi:hypothetical protein
MSDGVMPGTLYWPPWVLDEVAGVIKRASRHCTIIARSGEQRRGRSP